MRAAAPPDAIDLVIARAGELYALRRWRDAALLFRQALGARPDDAALMRDLSLCHSMLGELDEALRLADGAVAADPANANSHLRRFWPLRKQGKLKKARAAVEEALRLDPEHGEALGALADVLFDLGKVKEAEAVALRIQRLAPENPSSYRGLAFGALQRRKYAEAESWARRALALEPNEAASHNLLGVALWRRNRERDALASFHDALRADPTHEDARTNFTTLAHGWLSLDAAYARPPATWRQARWTLVARWAIAGVIFGIVLAFPYMVGTADGGWFAIAWAATGVLALCIVASIERHRYLFRRLPESLRDAIAPQGCRFTRTEEWGALAMGIGLVKLTVVLLSWALGGTAPDSLPRAFALCSAVALAAGGAWALLRSRGARAWRPGRPAGFVSYAELRRAQKETLKQTVLQVALRAAISAASSGAAV